MNHGCVDFSGSDCYNENNLFTEGSGPMQNIDLHMHSIYSDGTYTPAELVAFAKQKGLSALSLTDHDTIDGLEEARLCCKFRSF